MRLIVYNPAYPTFPYIKWGLPGCSLHGPGIIFKTFFTLNTIVGILIFISRKNFMLSSAVQRESLSCWYLIFIGRTNFILSWVEHEKSFITLSPVNVISGLITLPWEIWFLAVAHSFFNVFMRWNIWTMVIPTFFQGLRSTVIQWMKSWDRQLQKLISTNKLVW